MRDCSCPLISYQSRKVIVINRDPVELLGRQPELRKQIGRLIGELADPKLGSSGIRVNLHLYSDRFIQELLRVLCESGHGESQRQKNPDQTPEHSPL